MLSFLAYLAIHTQNSIKNGIKEEYEKYTREHDTTRPSKLVVGIKMSPERVMVVSATRTHCGRHNAQRELRQCCCLPAHNAIHAYQDIELQILLFIQIYAENALVFSQSCIRGRYLILSASLKTIDIQNQ